MSIAQEQTAHCATAFRLTDIEREKLWRVFGSVDRDLARLATAMLRFRPVGDSMDMVQESFVLFARRAMRGGLRCLGNRRIADVADSELDERIPFCRAYLIRILVCRCCWYYRKKKLDPIGANEANEWADQDLEGREAGPTETLSQQEVVNAVRRAILTLPEHLQKIVTMRYYGRCSEEEIAAASHIPQGTVKSRLHGAKTTAAPLVAGNGRGRAMKRHKSGWRRGNENPSAPQRERMARWMWMPWTNCCEMTPNAF